jgi:hypothetical protein
MHCDEHVVAGLDWHQELLRSPLFGRLMKRRLANDVELSVHDNKVLGAVLLHLLPFQLSLYDPLLYHVQLILLHDRLVCCPEVGRTVPLLLLLQVSKDALKLLGRRRLQHV